MAEPTAIRLDVSQSDESPLSGASPMMLNLLVEGPPREGQPRAVRTRPGLRAWSLFPATLAAEHAHPVVAMTILGGDVYYVTDSGAKTGLDRRRRVYSVSSTGGWRSLSAAATEDISGTGPVRLATARHNIFAVGGADMSRINAGGVARVSGPPPASDVALLAQRLVVVENAPEGRFYWSLPGDGNLETFDTVLDFREAEARPDRAVACGATARELFLFGSETLQVFSPDATETFTPGPSPELGARSPTTVFRVDSAFAWLDSHERAVVGDGRNFDIVSDRGMADTFKGLASPETVWGFRSLIGRFDLLTWVADESAYTYEANSQTWSEWRSWRDGRWQAWAPTSYVYHPDIKAHLVGMPDGTIAELTLESTRDLDDPLKWVARTGFDMGARRHVTEARFAFERGQAASADSVIDIRWRDDVGDFNPPARFPLGVPGTRDPEVSISPAGAPHRRRQWEVSGDGDDVYRILPATAYVEEANF